MLFLFLFRSFSSCFVSDWIPNTNCSCVCVVASRASFLWLIYALSSQCGSCWIFYFYFWWVVTLRRRLSWDWRLLFGCLSFGQRGLVRSHMDIKMNIHYFKMLLQFSLTDSLPCPIFMVAFVLASITEISKTRKLFILPFFHYFFLSYFILYYSFIFI